MQYKDKNGKFLPIYNSWYAMKQRCNNLNNKQYKDYGGRGITYPNQWESFIGFFEDMGLTHKIDFTLDRTDNNKGYSKENCRWATRKEQNLNKRSNHILVYRGKKMTMPEWAEYLGIDFGTLRSRFYRGMSTAKILKIGLYRPRKI